MYKIIFIALLLLSLNTKAGDSTAVIQTQEDAFNQMVAEYIQAIADGQWRLMFDQNTRIVEK